MTKIFYYPARVAAHEPKRAAHARADTDRQTPTVGLAKDLQKKRSNGRYLKTKRDIVMGPKAKMVALNVLLAKIGLPEQKTEKTIPLHL